MEHSPVHRLPVRQRRARALMRTDFYVLHRLWGDVLVWGASNKLKTPGECCDACRKYKPEQADGGTCNGECVRVLKYLLLPLLHRLTSLTLRACVWPLGCSLGLLR